jgi:hypothetical protein
VEEDAATVRGFEAAEDVEQGGFAGTRGTAEEDAFALSYRKADAAEHLDLPGTDMVGAAEVFCGQAAGTGLGGGHGVDERVAGELVKGCSGSLKPAAARCPGGGGAGGPLDR